MVEGFNVTIKRFVKLKFNFSFWEKFITLHKSEISFYPKKILNSLAISISCHAFERD